MATKNEVSVLPRNEESPLRCTSVEEWVTTYIACIFHGRLIFAIFQINKNL